MSVVNVSTYLITSITANPFEFPTILVTMSVLILTTVVNLLYMSTLRVRIPLRPGVLDTTLCAKVCHDLGSSVGLSGYSDHHNITEILLKVALNPITVTLYMSKTLQDIPPSTKIVSCIKCQKLVKTSLPRQRLSLVSKYDFILPIMTNSNKIIHFCILVYMINLIIKKKIMLFLTAACTICVLPK
jgi:hypothetical protein